MEITAENMRLRATVPSPDLNYVLEEIRTEAEKGEKFIRCEENLSQDSINELRRRGFYVDVSTQVSTGHNAIVSWFPPGEIECEL